MKLFDIQSTKDIKITVTVLTLIVVAVSILLTVIIKKAIIGHISFDSLIIATVIPLIISPSISILIFRQSLKIYFLNQKIEELSRIDELTRLYNRRFFMELLEKEFVISKRYSNSLAILMIDFDHFKDVNDNYGHLAGDHILRESSRILLALLRESDIAARFGGEEVIIYCPHTTLKSAHLVAERLREKIEADNFTYENRVIPITISIGCAAYDNTDKSTQAIEQIIKTADENLYKSKSAGRNRVS